MQVVAVIRSHGERTKDLCQRLVRQQIAVECIEVAPFTEAVRRCFEIGIASKADWLLTIDADVLVLPNAIDRLIQRARDASRRVFHFQGVVRDKLKGKARPAGHRMYRVRCLEQLLPLIEDSIRVEARLVHQHARTGVVSVTYDDVFGLHDYEQWYADIYRKAAVHAVKHQCWRIDGWRASSDPDLQAAFAGWCGLPWTLPEKPPLPADARLPC